MPHHSQCNVTPAVTRTRLTQAPGPGRRHPGSLITSEGHSGVLSAELTLRVGDVKTSLSASINRLYRKADVLAEPFSYLNVKLLLKITQLSLSFRLPCREPAERWREIRVAVSVKTALHHSSAPLAVNAEQWTPPPAPPPAQPLQSSGSATCR